MENMLEKLTRTVECRARRYLSAPTPSEAAPDLLDVNDDVNHTIRDVQPFTMTSPERIAALINAVRYVVQSKIPGGIVECGVWRGGSMMAVARTLMQLEKQNRDLYLFDTFDGMSSPTHQDVAFDGVEASVLLKRRRKNEHDVIWAFSPLDRVRENMMSTGYAEENMHFVKGRVEDTIPQGAPATISLLRLDTDWYESTRHELIHLFPRLSPGGVLIIDDYGHWQGSKKAVDEYLETNKISLLLNRIDYTGRIGIKWK